MIEIPDQHSFMISDHDITGPVEFKDRFDQIGDEFTSFTLINHSKYIGQQSELATSVIGIIDMQNVRTLRKSQKVF